MLGPEHPDVAASYTGLGNVYDRQGKHEEALGTQSKALEIRLKVLGPDHPDVAASYNSLGSRFIDLS